MDGDGAAERLAVEHHPARRNTLGLDEARRRPGVLVEAFLRRRPGITAVAAIADQKNPEAGVEVWAHALGPGGDVAAVAVEIDHRRPAVLRRLVPGAQRQAVGGRQRHLAHVAGADGGGAADVRGGQEQQVALEDVEDADDEDVAEEDRCEGCDHQPDVVSRHVRATIPLSGANCVAKALTLPLRGPLALSHARARGKLWPIVSLSSRARRAGGERDWVRVYGIRDQQDTSATAGPGGGGSAAGGASSSNRIRCAAPSRSSYCPDLIAQRKPTRPISPSPSAAGMR